MDKEIASEAAVEADSSSSGEATPKQHQTYPNNTNLPREECLVSSDGDQLVSEDGTVLPLKRSSLEVCRTSALWRPHSEGQAFKRVLYDALKKVGYGGGAVCKDMEVLLRRAREFGLSRHEARLLYGFERGVIGKSGRFLKVADVDFGARLDERLVFDGRRERKLGRRFDADDWSMIEDEALACCRDLPDQADRESELIWVGTRSREWPEFKSAPSRMAVKFWLAMNDPGRADTFERDFFRSLYFKSSARSVSVASRSSDDGDVVVDGELHRKLFGGEEDGGG